MDDWERQALSAHIAQRMFEVTAWDTAMDSQRIRDAIDEYFDGLDGVDARELNANPTVVHRF
jgi:hypothetical protein